MFEVQDLRYATLATVSRCGMVWFSEDVLSTELVFENFISKLRNVPLEESDEGIIGGRREEEKEELSPLMKVWLCHVLEKKIPLTGSQISQGK